MTNRMKMAGIVLHFMGDKKFVDIILSERAADYSGSYIKEELFQLVKFHGRVVIFL